ncbi:MAG: DUF3352 domain-containing protein [Planctomycetes bacterium]|nr:DUF3352 domain-containing protein [Planctomycetota bacterium]
MRRTMIGRAGGIALALTLAARASDADRTDSISAMPAKAMPAEPLLYLEFDSPGEKVLQLIDLAAEANPDRGPALKILRVPVFAEEIRKVRSVAATITGGEPGRPEGLVVLAVEKTSALRTILGKFLPAGAEKRIHRDTEISTLRSRRGELSVAFLDDLIILGNPVGEVEAALDRLAGAAPSLADSQTFRQAVARDRRPGSFAAYTDGPKLLETLATIHPPTARDRLGAKALELDRLGSLAIRAIFEDSLAIEGEARFRDGTPRLARILHTPPVDPALLAWLPADTSVAMAFSVGDGETMWAELTRFAEEMYDEALREGIAEGDRPSIGIADLEAGLGFGIGNDVLGNLSAVALGFRQPGRHEDDPPILVAKVKDAAAAGGTARMFLERVGQHVTGMAVAVEHDASGTVAVDKVYLSPALEPACAIIGDVLVMGPTPARVRAAIAARETPAPILGGARIPDGAVKLMILRPAVLATSLTGREAEVWGLIAQAAGDTPILVWTEEGEGRVALKARVPNLPGLLVKIAERKKRG